MPTPLIMGAAQRELLATLREYAAGDPVEMTGLRERIETADGKRAHMDRMHRHTVEIPVGFLVTFTIETGHPIGACRHMSMSSPRQGKVPSPEAIQWVCDELGFVGKVVAEDSTCHVWIEDLLRGDGQRREKAVNVVQPIAVSAAAQA